MFYAVSKTTKEHFDARNFSNESLNDEDLLIIEADPDGWIEWHGGECPLPDEAGAEYITRSEFIGSYCAAGELAWRAGLTEHDLDIIAYRPILDAKPEPPEWDGEGLPPVGCECEYQLHKDKKWFEAKVDYSSEDFVVLISRIGGQEIVQPIHHHEADFRPIRSDEDRTVEEMVSAMRTTDDSGMYGYAHALYRAGYRKV